MPSALESLVMESGVVEMVELHHRLLVIVTGAVALVVVINKGCCTTLFLLPRVTEQGVVVVARGGNLSTAGSSHRVDAFVCSYSLVQ